MRRYIALLLLFFAHGGQLLAAEIPDYPEIAINPKQVYTVEAFPYSDYFVCIRENDKGEGVAQYLEHDPLFKQSLRQAAGETAAMFYRYINELPAKDTLLSNPAMSPNFPLKQQAPFLETKSYYYSHQNFSQIRRKYHYAITTLELLQEQNHQSHNRYWIKLEPNFFRRINEHEVIPDWRFTGLHLYLSLSIHHITFSESEQQAYSAVARSTELYFKPTHSEDCHKPIKPN